MGTGNPMTGEHLIDEHELREFGYQQQLRRTMHGFSSFAISFSLISVITGIFANFHFGIQQVGGILVWSWLLVGAGQFMVALVMADLSTRFPISGYGYQWTSRLTNSHLGFFVGWLLLMQFITGFPGVCQALADTLYGMAGGGPGGWAVTGITVLVITLITVVHLFGIKLVSRVNDVGVFAEILGVIILILLLGGAWILSGNMNLSNLVNATHYVSGEAAGFSAFALSLLVGAWCLTGFEAAADLAEETHQPRKTVPRAVITSQVSATLAGFLLIAIFILSVPDLRVLQESDSPIVWILNTRLGIFISTLIGLIALLSIFACGVASMATATRLIYSMARDQMLPFSGLLKKINPTFQTPRRAVLVVWALGCLFVISIRQLEIITSISAVAAYLGYCGIMIAALITRKETSLSEGFTLGRYRKPVRWISLAWTLIVVLALTIPANQISSIKDTHIPAKSTFVALVTGILVYFIIIRSRIKSGQAGPPENNINQR
jgi:amino acid transporter